MNWPVKSTASSRIPDLSAGELRARRQCLLALFPDWTGGDPFLLDQLRLALEAALPDPSDFAAFSQLASRLRRREPDPQSRSHAFRFFDFSNRTYDPLFAHHEIIQTLKPLAATDHIFLVIRGLRRALAPHARYRTTRREDQLARTRASIDALARRWSTPSSTIHLLYF